MKVKNVSRRKKFLILNNSSIDYKTGSFLSNGQKIDMADCAVLILKSSCSITGSAINTLSCMGTQVQFCSDLDLTAIIPNQRRKPILKLKQYDLVSKLKKRERAIRILFKERNKTLTEIGYNKSIKISSYKENTKIMLEEAKWAKRFYMDIYKTHGKKWMGKNNQCQYFKNAHLMYKWLYAVISNIITGMGMDQDLALLHGNHTPGGLIYDLADIFKPIYLSAALIESEGKTYNEIKEIFWNSTRRFQVRKRLVKILKEIL